MTLTRGLEIILPICSCYRIFSINSVNLFYDILFIYELFFLNTKYFNTCRERGENFKQTDSGVYPKGLNSWIHNIGFKEVKRLIIFVL